MTLIYLFGFIYVGVAIYLANQEDAKRIAQSVSSDSAYAMSDPVRYLRLLLYGLAGLTILAGFLVLQQGFISQLEGPLPAELAELPKVDMVAALVSLALAGLAGSLSIAIITSPRARQWVKRVVGQSGTYHPESYVHLTALVLALTVLSGTISMLVAGGGLSGLAQDIERGGGIGVGELIFNAVLYVSVALLGVGLAIRRSLSECLERLRLKSPTPTDVRWGVGMGLALFVVSLASSEVLKKLLTSEQLREQGIAAQEITQGFDTVPLAVLVALTAGIGEEILFRGALQPVFGLLPAAIFFGLVHSQYALTSLSLVIIIVGLGLGWLRQRQSTTAAIIAHVTYNFIPLILLIWSRQVLGS